MSAQYNCECGSQQKGGIQLKGCGRAEVHSCSHVSVGSASLQNVPCLNYSQRYPMQGCPTCGPRIEMAKNTAQHKIVNLLKTFFCSSVFISVCVFNVWSKTTLPLPVWPRDAKRMDTPAWFTHNPVKKQPWQTFQLIMAAWRRSTIPSCPTGSQVLIAPVNVSVGNQLQSALNTHPGSDCAQRKHSRFPTE